MAGPQRATASDYAQKNYESLKQTQMANKAKRDEAQNQPVKKPFKLKRFDKVESLVNKTPSEVAKIKENTQPRVVTYDAGFAPV